MNSRYGDVDDGGARKCGFVLLAWGASAFRDRAAAFGRMRARAFRGMDAWEHDVSSRLRVVAAERRILEEYFPLIVDEMHVDILDCLGEILRDAENAIWRRPPGATEQFADADRLLRLSISGRKLLQQRSGLLRVIRSGATQREGGA